MKLGRLLLISIFIIIILTPGSCSKRPLSDSLTGHGPSGEAKAVFLDHERYANLDGERFANSIKDISSIEAQADLLDISIDTKDNNFTKNKSSLNVHGIYNEARAVYLDDERFAKFKNNSIKDISSNEAQADFLYISIETKDNNFAKNKPSLNDHGIYNEARAVYLDDERFAKFKNNSIKDISSNEAQADLLDISIDTKDNNFTKIKSSLYDHWRYDEAKAVYLDSEKFANSIKDTYSNEAQVDFLDISLDIKDNNFTKIKSSLNDHGTYDEARAVYLDDERFAKFRNNSIKDISSNEAQADFLVISIDIKDNNFTKIKSSLTDLMHQRHQQAEPKDTSDEIYIYICTMGTAFGKPDRRKKNKNNAKNADSSDSMITHIEPDKACLKLGGIADYILAIPERTSILRALSQQPKTFIDLLNETSLEKEILKKYLRRLMLDGFVVRIDASPLLFTWSEELIEYCSLGMKKYRRN